MNKPPTTNDVRQALTERIDWYESVHRMSVDIEHDEEASDELLSVFSFEYPGSAVSMLAGLLWLLDHPFDEEGYESSVTTAAFVAISAEHFSADAARRIGRPLSDDDAASCAGCDSEVRSWPREDAQAILQWFEWSVASGLAGSESEQSLKDTRAYWQARAHE